MIEFIMDNICYLNGHLLYDIDNFKKILNNAIKNPTGQDYCGILDLIWEGSLERWLKLHIDEQLCNNLIAICSDIRSRNITEYDGVCKLSLLFNLKGQNSAQRNDYIQFENTKLYIKGDADFQDACSSSCDFEIKRDNKWPVIVVSTHCTILKPIDHIFEFKLLVTNKGNDKQVFEEEYCVNPHEYFYKKEKVVNIEIKLRNALDDGEYDIKFADIESVNKSSVIQSTSLMIKKYNYEDCFELKSVVVTGDSLYKHKTLSDTFCVIHNTMDNIRVCMDNEVLKSVDQNFTIHIKMGDIEDIQQINTGANPIATFCLPIKNLSVGIYQIVITTENKYHKISDNCSLFITGAKHTVNINDELALGFIEIVDKHFHYLVGETVITAKEYNTIMGLEKSESLLPYIFHDFGDIKSYRQACNFIDNLRKLTRNSNIDRVSLKVWNHLVENANLSVEMESLDDIAWYKQNSGGKLHPVKTKKSSILGVYDILGNISILTSSKDDINNKILDSKCFIVGGNYLSPKESLKDSNKVSIPDKGHSFGIRLMILLPEIHDSRDDKYSDISYSSYEPDPDPFPSWLNTPSF